MPVSIDCPSCKGHLLIPDALWRQRFVGRVQRMTCKKCRKTVEIDGRGSGFGRVSRIPQRPTGGLAGATGAQASVRAEDVGAPDSRPASQPLRIDPLPHETSGHAGQELNARGVTPARRRPLVPDLSDPDLWLHLARNVAGSEPPPPTSGAVRRKRFAARRMRWMGISGVAAAAVATTCWLLWGAERGSASSAAPTTPFSARPLAAGPSERETSPPPSTESAPPAASLDETRGADAAAATAPTPTPTHEAVVSEQAASPASAPPYDTVKLQQILRWAVRNAEECHKEGRSAGTAQLFITFSPSGKVSQAELVGEPIASAPVARCILDYARAIFLPPFDGPSFTVSRGITLR